MIRFGLALILAGIFIGLPAPARAGARVSVTVGDDCCWYGQPAPYHHHHHNPHWGRPVYVVPPPVIYEPAPVVVVPARPSVVYVEPPRQPMAASPASPDYRTSSGQTCREYQSSVVIGGVSRPSYGTACLQPDGTWRVVR
jgi:hypothetical protein